MTCVCGGWDGPFGPDHPLWLVQIRTSCRYWTYCESCGRLVGTGTARLVYAGSGRRPA